MGAQYKSLAPEDDLLAIGINRAVALLAEPTKGRAQTSTPAKEIGNHPEDGKPIKLQAGRFGPYVKWGKVNATVTKAYDPEKLTLEQAVELLAAKIEKSGAKPAPKKKAPAKKASPKKKTTKKKE